MSLRSYLSGEDERQQLEKRMRAEGRLPPGQSVTIKWPILHEGPVPSFDAANWDFRIGGLVEQPLALDWAAFRALPRVERTTDFHCVTRWSSFDNRWQGVPLRELLRQARPASQARFAMVLGHKGRERYGYSTNLPLADLERDDVLLAERRNGEELTPEHGGPVRLLVPHLYAWKSAKWVRGLILMAEDKPGYWERLGYHQRGDPFAEERFGDG